MSAVYKKSREENIQYVVGKDQEFISVVVTLIKSGEYPSSGTIVPDRCGTETDGNFSGFEVTSKTDVAVGRGSL
jgi:hypothetical protein